MAWTARPRTRVRREHRYASTLRASWATPGNDAHRVRIPALPAGDGGARPSDSTSAGRRLLLEGLGRSVRAARARRRSVPRVRLLVGERLAALEDRLRDLAALRDEMRGLVQEWDARLAATPKGQRAQLLDMLVGHPALDGGTRAPSARGADRGSAKTRQLETPRSAKGADQRFADRPLRRMQNTCDSKRSCHGRLACSFDSAAAISRRSSRISSRSRPKKLM